MNTGLGAPTQLHVTPHIPLQQLHCNDDTEINTLHFCSTHLSVH